jgi:hypothetical protein
MMTRLSRGAMWRSLSHGSCATALLLGMAAIAPAAHAADSSDDRVTRLVQLLIQKGILSPHQASSLMQETETPSGHPASGASRAHASHGTASAATAQAGAADGEPAAPPGSVRVTYVPPIVREQIAAEVKQQVMQEAQDQGWAEPNQIPGWTQRIKITGDVRVRGAFDMLSKNNFPAFPNFNAINGSPNGFDAYNSAGTLPPLLNTTQNRFQSQIRARLDVTAHIADWIDTEIRVATGNSNTPVSTNQTLGNPGDYSKYAIWLDRAAIILHPASWLTINAGRAANPFWTTNLIFDDNVNFDGISAQIEHQIAGPVDGFLTFGAFPVFNTDFNFGSTQLQKTASHNSYLFAVQGGADWKINDNYDAKFGAGYFNFSNVSGKLSSPCLNPTSYGSCNTDNTKAPFLQFGNTLIPIRNIVQDPSSTTTSSPQFYGLASNFDILDLHGSFTLANFHPIDVVFEGEFVKNLGFNRQNILNRGPANNIGASNHWQGGDTGYTISATVGHQSLEKPWDWNASIAYRYLESDAVLDALTDSDFHLGGTNAKGYILGGNLAINKNAWLAATWLSANQVSGQPYSADVLLLDLNAKF